LRAPAPMSRSGTRVAICNAAMRERSPKSGFGIMIALAVVAAAAVLALRTLLVKIPRP
jgi:hypothetical protein